MVPPRISRDRVSPGVPDPIPESVRPEAPRAEETPPSAPRRDAARDSAELASTEAARETFSTRGTTSGPRREFAESLSTLRDLQRSLASDPEGPNASADRDRIRQLIESLRPQADAIRDHPRSAPRDLAEDMRLVRSFYRSGSPFLESHRSRTGTRAFRQETATIGAFRDGMASTEGSLRLLRDTVRTSVRELSRPPTLEQAGSLRLVAEISLEVGDRADLIRDARHWRETLLALPETERDGRAGNSRLQELLDLAAGCEAGGFHDIAQAMLNEGSLFATHIHGSARTLAHFQIIAATEVIPGERSAALRDRLETLSRNHLTSERLGPELRHARAVEQGMAILWLRSMGHEMGASEELLTVLQETGGLANPLAAVLARPDGRAADLADLAGRVPHSPSERMIVGLAADTSARGLASYDPTACLELAQMDSYSGDMLRFASMEGITGDDLSLARRTFSGLRGTRDRVLEHLAEDPALRADQLAQIVEVDRALLAFARHINAADAVTEMSSALSEHSSTLRTLHDESLRTARSETTPIADRLASIRIASGAAEALGLGNERAVDLTVWQTLLTETDDTVISTEDRFTDFGTVFRGFHELRQRHYDERSADMRDDRWTWTEILTFGLAGASEGRTIPGRLAMEKDLLTRHLTEIQAQMTTLLPSLSDEDSTGYVQRLTSLVEARPGLPASNAAEDILPFLSADGFRVFQELPAAREAALTNLLGLAGELASAGHLSSRTGAEADVSGPLAHEITIGEGDSAESRPLTDFVSLSGSELSTTEAFSSLSLPDRMRVMREVIHFGHLREYEELHIRAVVADSPMQYFHAARLDLESGDLNSAQGDLTRFLHETRGSTDPDIITARASAFEMNRSFLTDAVDRIERTVSELHAQRLGNIEMNYYDDLHYESAMSLIAQIRRVIGDPSLEIATVDEAIAHLERESADRIHAFAEHPVIRSGLSVDLRMSDFGDSHGVPREGVTDILRQYLADPSAEIEGVPNAVLEGGTLYFQPEAAGNRGTGLEFSRTTGMAHVRVGRAGGDIVVRVGGEHRLYHFEPSDSDRNLIINGSEIYEGRERLIYSPDYGFDSHMPNPSHPDHPHMLRDVLGFMATPLVDPEFHALVHFESYEAIQERAISPMADRTARLELAQTLRARNGSYETASRTFLELMEPELRGIRAGISMEERTRIGIRVEMERGEAITEIRHRIFDEYDERGMPRPTQAQIDGMVEDAMALRLTSSLRSRELEILRDRITSGEITDPIVRQSYEEYNDMNDPHGEWTNFSDASWDQIITEVVINAPLMALSGGAANLAAGGARMLLTRAAARYLAEAGTEYIVRSGGRMALGAASRRLLVRGGIYTAGLVVEGSTFELANRGLRATVLQEEGLFRHPGELGRAMGASILMMGAIHGGNALWGGMAGRVGLGSEALREATGLSVTLRRGAAYTGQLATEGAALTAVGYANPMVFGGPEEHGDAGERFLHSIGIILQLRLGGHLFQSMTGHALQSLQANLESRILQSRIRGVVEHGMGVDPTSADGRILAEALNISLAGGRSIESVEGMVSRSRLEALRRSVEQELGMDPTTERGRDLTAQLLLRVMAEAREPGRMDAVMGELPGRLGELSSTIRTIVTERAGVRGERGEQIYEALLAQALTQGHTAESFLHLNASLTLLIEQGGFGSGEEAAHMRIALLQFCASTGRRGEEIDAFLEHTDGLSDRIHDLTNQLYGPRASSTPFGRGVSSDLLIWALSRSATPAELPSRLEALADTMPEISAARDGCLRDLGLRGDSTTSVLISQHLMSWALSRSSDAGGVREALESNRSEMSRIHSTIRDAVRELGYPEGSEGGDRITGALLLRLRGEAGGETAFNSTLLSAYSTSIVDLGRQVDFLMASDVGVALRPHRSRILAWAIETAATPEALHQLGLELQSGERAIEITPEGNLLIIEAPSVVMVEELPAGEAVAIDMAARAEPLTEFLPPEAPSAHPRSSESLAEQRHFLAEIAGHTRLLNAGASAPTFLRALSAELESGRMTLDAESVERVAEIFSADATNRVLNRLPHEQRIEIRQALLFEILEGRITGTRGIGDRIFEMRMDPNRFDGVRMGGGERPTLLRAELLPRIAESTEGFEVLERFGFVQGSDGPMMRGWTRTRIALEQLADPGQPTGPLVSLARRTRSALETAYESAREIESLSGRTPPPPELDAARSRLAEATRQLETWEALTPTWMEAFEHGEALEASGATPFRRLRLALESSASEMTRTDRSLSPEESPSDAFEPGAALEAIESTHPMRAVDERILAIDSWAPEAGELADAWLDPSRGDQGRGSIRAGEVTLVVREGADIPVVADAAVTRLAEFEIFRGIDPTTLSLERSTEANGTTRLEFGDPANPNLRFVVRVVEQSVARAERTEAVEAFERASRFEAEEIPIPELREAAPAEAEAPVAEADPSRAARTVRPGARAETPTDVEEGTRAGTPRRLAERAASETPEEVSELRPTARPPRREAETPTREEETRAGTPRRITPETPAAEVESATVRAEVAERVTPILPPAGEAVEVPTIPREGRLPSVEEAPSESGVRRTERGRSEASELEVTATGTEDLSARVERSTVRPTEAAPVRRERSTEVVRRASLETPIPPLPTEGPIGEAVQRGVSLETGDSPLAPHARRAMERLRATREGTAEFREALAEIETLTEMANTAHLRLPERGHPNHAAAIAFRSLAIGAERSLGHVAPGSPEYASGLEAYRRGRDATARELIAAHGPAMESVLGFLREVGDGGEAWSAVHERHPFLEAPRFAEDIPPHGRLKAESEVLSKLNRRGWTSLEPMTDLAGTRAVVESYEDVMPLVAALQARYTIREVRDGAGETSVRRGRTEIDRDGIRRLIAGNRSGYRAIHVVVEVEGRPVEIQIQTRAMYEWGQIQHGLVYAAVRGRGASEGPRAAETPIYTLPGEVRSAIDAYCQETASYLSDLEVGAVPGERPSADGVMRSLPGDMPMEVRENLRAELTRMDDLMSETRRIFLHEEVPVEESSGGAIIIAFPQRRPTVTEEGEMAIAVELPPPPEAVETSETVLPTAVIPRAEPIVYRIGAGGGPGLIVAVPEGRSPAWRVRDIEGNRFYLENVAEPSMRIEVNSPVPPPFVEGQGVQSMGIGGGGRAFPTGHPAILEVRGFTESVRSLIDSPFADMMEAGEVAALRNYAKAVERGEAPSEEMAAAALDAFRYDTTVIGSDGRSLSGGLLRIPLNPPAEGSPYRAEVVSVDAAAGTVTVRVRGHERTLRGVIAGAPPFRAGQILQYIPPVAGASGSAFRMTPPPDASTPGEIRPVPGASQFTVGRGHTAITDPALSTNHAVFRRGEDGRWMVEDLNSTNGLHILGPTGETLRVPPGHPVALQEGSMLHIGTHWYRFHPPIESGLVLPVAEFRRGVPEVPVVAPPPGASRFSLYGITVERAGDHWYALSGDRPIRLNGQGHSGNTPLRAGDVIEVAGRSFRFQPELRVREFGRDVASLRVHDMGHVLSEALTTVIASRLLPGGEMVELTLSQLELTADSADRQIVSVLRVPRSVVEEAGLRLDEYGLLTSDSPRSITLRRPPAPEPTYAAPVVITHPAPAAARGGPYRESSTTERVDLPQPVDGEGNVYSVALASRAPLGGGTRRMTGHPIRVEFHPDSTAYVTFEGRVGGESAPRRFVVRMSSDQARELELGRADRPARDYAIAFLHGPSRSAEPVRPPARPAAPPPPPARVESSDGNSYELRPSAEPGTARPGARVELPAGSLPTHIGRNARLLPETGGRVHIAMDLLDVRDRSSSATVRISLTRDEAIRVGILNPDGQLSSTNIALHRIGEAAPPAGGGETPPQPPGTVRFADRGASEFTFGRETEGASADLSVAPDMRMISRRQARFRMGETGLEVHADAREGTWILHSGRWQELHATDGWYRLPEGAHLAFGRPAGIEASRGRRSAPAESASEHLIEMEVGPGGTLRAAPESGLRWTPAAEAPVPPARPEPVATSPLSGEPGIVLLPDGARYEIRGPEPTLRRGAGGGISFGAYHGEALEIVSTAGETLTFRAQLRNIREMMAGREGRSSTTFSMPRSEAIERRLIDAEGRVIASSFSLEIPAVSSPEALARAALPRRADGAGIDLAALPDVLGAGVADPTWRDHPVEDLGGVAASGSEGRGYSDHNEDRYVVFTTPEGRSVTVVIDGMGGHGGGERAASIARAVIAQALERGVPVDQALELAHSAMVQDNRERRSDSGAVAASVELRPTAEGDYAIEMRRIGDSDAAGFDLSRGAEEPIVGRTERHTEGETREIRLNSGSAVDSAMGLSQRGPQEVTSLRMRAGQVLLVGSDGFWENFIDYSEVREIMMRSPDRSADGLRSALLTEVQVRQRLLEMRGRGAEPWTITPERYRQAYQDVTGSEAPSAPPWRYLGGTLERNGRVLDSGGHGMGRFKADNVTLVVQIVGEPVARPHYGERRPGGSDAASMPLAAGPELVPVAPAVPNIPSSPIIPPLIVVGVPGGEPGSRGSDHPFGVARPETRDGVQIYQMTLDEIRVPPHAPSRVEVRSPRALQASALENVLSPRYREAEVEVSAVYGERIPLSDLPNGGSAAPVIDFYATADTEAAAAPRSPGHPSVVIADPAASDSSPLFAILRQDAGWRLMLQADGVRVLDAEGRPHPPTPGNPRAFDLRAGDRVQFGITELVYDGRALRSEATTETRVHIPAGDFH